MRSLFVIAFLCIHKEVAGYFDTEEYLKILDCVYNKDIAVVRVVTIKNGQSLNVSTLLDNLIPSLYSRFEVTMLQASYTVDYEMSPLFYEDLFNWQGQRFPIRPSQKSQKVVYDDPLWPIQTSRRRKNFGLVILSENVETLDKYMTGTARPPFYAPRGRYVIIFAETLSLEARQNLDRLLRKMWTDYALLIAVAFSAQNLGEFYHFNPFVRINTHLVDEDAIRNISNWGRVELTKSLTLDLCDRSFETYPLNFNGYPVRIVIFRREPTATVWRTFPKSFLNTNLGRLQRFSPEISGVDGMLFASIVEALNITPIRYDIDSRNPYPYKNGSNIIAGSGEVIYSRYDIAMNLHFILGNTMSYEYLQPFAYDKYCIITKKALPLPSYQSMFRSFSIGMWCLIIFLPIILGCIWTMLDRIGPSMGDRMPLWHMIMVMYFIVFSLPMKFKMKKSVERVFIISVLVYSIVFASIFNGLFTTNFTKGASYEDITNLEQLSQTNLKISTTSLAMIGLLFGVDSVDDPKIKALKRKMMASDSDAVERIVENNVCLIFQQTDFDIMQSRYKNIYGRERLHQIEECPRTFYSSYIIRKGYPLSERFNSVLSQFSTAGLVNYWYNVTKYAFELRTEIEFLDKRRVYSTVSLTVHDLWPFFVILVLGNFVGCGVFWWEIRNYTNLLTQSSNLATLARNAVPSQQPPQALA